MDVTVITVTFGTIHRHSSLEEIFDIWLWSYFDRYKTLLNII